MFVLSVSCSTGSLSGQRRRLETALNCTAQGFISTAGSRFTERNPSLPAKRADRCAPPSKPAPPCRQNDETRSLSTRSRVPRRHMERRLGLHDRLAGRARGLLAHRLDHPPLTRDRLQCLGDVVAQPRQCGRSAAGAAFRRRDHDAPARQMLRNGRATALVCLGCQRLQDLEFVCWSLVLKFINVKRVLPEWRLTWPTTAQPLRQFPTRI